jgi:peptidoglycan/LPS O-acetylase OafA/YrhL
VAFPPAPEAHRGRHAVVTRAETERGVRPEAGLESVPAHPADRGLPVVANRAHFPGLDGMRAIAAVMVIFTHVADATGSYSSTFLGAFFARMDAGVAVFFVLSGFLLYRPFVVAHFADSRPPALLPFWWRRFLRIVPAYWLVLTFFIVIGTIPVPGWGHIGYLYGFGQIYSKAHVLDGLVQAWTLCVEITFYLFLPIFALALRAIAGRITNKLRVELFAVAVLWVAGVTTHTLLLATHKSSTPSTLWLPSQIDLFALGMLLAVISAWSVHTGVVPRAAAAAGRHPWWCWIVAAAAFFMVSKVLDIPRGLAQLTTGQEMSRQLLYAATAFFLVLPAVFGPQDKGFVRKFLRTPVVAWLGLVSYGIYLWHKPILDELVARHNALGWVPGARFVSVFVVVVALTLVAAAISYYGLERPALRLKNRVPDRRPRPRERTHQA